MPKILFWITGVVFVAPAVILLALFILNRYSKGNPSKAINLLWAVLGIMLIGFLFFAVRSGAG